MPPPGEIAVAQRTAAALFAALVLFASSAPAQSAQRDVELLYKKALDMSGCSERWATNSVVSECRQVIAAYRAAEAAADATPAEREFLAVARLQEQATLAAALRKGSSSRKEARAEIDAALRELDGLAPGGENAFVRVQTLDLQRQRALLELDDGNAAAADAAIDEYRKHSQGFLGAIEQLRANLKAMNQQRMNAIEAANFESELGDYYAAALEKADAAIKDGRRAKAVEAYERARQWAVARADNDWNGFAEASPAVMYAEASLDLAKLAHDANDAQALATYVGEAKAVACSGAKSGDNYSDSELDERCMRTVIMEGWVTGANQALLRRISEQNDERMRAVVDALRKKK
jgi:hypothetical protein